MHPEAPPAGLLLAVAGGEHHEGSMSNDPYTPPSAPVRDRVPEPGGSAWKAVTFGVLADVLATFVGSILLFALLGSFMVSQGASPENLDANLMSSDVTMLLGLALGLACTVLGGYVTARTARRREYYHALLTGIVVLVLGEVMLSGSPDGSPLALRIIGNILVIPAALLGAYLHKSARTEDVTEQA
jgi:hypothetical protein